MSAEIITIGTELLTGSTTNTNASYLAEKLTSMGIETCFQTSVGDNYPHLESVLSEAIKRSEVIIVTGGLGPTVDDITKQAVSSVLKTRLILETSILSKIERFFKDRKKEIPSNNYNQALIIRGSMIINNETGTAPGLIIERGKNTIILLPGVPRELKQMFEHTVSKYLGKKYSKNLVIKSRTLRTFGLGESDLDEKITHVTEKYSNPCIAFLAHTTEVDIKITAKAGNQGIADSLIADVETQIRDCLGDCVFGADDETMEKIVAAILTLRNKTIAVAESCTGGLISNLLTNVSGSSAYFIESIIAYSNEAKIRLLHVSLHTIEEFGAVSSQTASAMAKGIKELAGTDYGLSVTGIAGPTGGTSEKPVGLVYIGLAHQNGVDTSEHKFFGTRDIIKQKAAQTALDTIRKYLINQT
ncbi:competence/damage-inducible protein A [bacterium]|nr:competence/damage-inducible protein A [bacterium]